jgi:hypothetical protein
MGKEKEEVIHKIIAKVLKVEEHHIDHVSYNLPAQDGCWHELYEKIILQ